LEGLWGWSFVVILGWFGSGGGGAAIFMIVSKIAFGVMVLSSLRWLLRAASL
jgi:uncharacterized membrane protein